MLQSSSEFPVQLELSVLVVGFCGPCCGLHVQALLMNDHRNNPVDTVRAVILRFDLSKVTLPMKVVEEFLIPELV